MRRCHEVQGRAFAGAALRAVGGFLRPHDLMMCSPGHVCADLGMFRCAHGTPRSGCSGVLARNFSSRSVNLPNCCTFACHHVTYRDDSVPATLPAATVPVRQRPFPAPPRAGRTGWNPSFPSQEIPACPLVLLPCPGQLLTDACRVVQHPAHAGLFAPCPVPTC